MTYLSAACGKKLPKYYFTLPGQHFGIEVDVAALERLEHDPKTRGWKPPEWNAPYSDGDGEIAIEEDELEILIHNRDATDVQLVGAIEFVSPANKDRPESRDAFVSKVHAYLQRGVGVVIVDIVTNKSGNLHNELVERVGLPKLTVDGDIYTTAYKVTGKKGRGKMEVWRRPLEIGQPIPTMPLWLYGGICIPVPLDESYEEACRELRVQDWADSYKRVLAPA
jgi:hypothetical protein